MACKQIIFNEDEFSVKEESKIAGVKMNRTIRRVAIDDFWKTLRSLGYYNVEVQGRRSEWRRGKLHLYTYPWAKKGVKLALHEDVWKGGLPAFSHRSRSEGKDLEQELDRIKKRYQEQAQQNT